ERCAQPLERMDRLRVVVNDASADDDIELVAILRLVQRLVAKLEMPEPKLCSVAAAYLDRNRREIRRDDVGVGVSKREVDCMIRAAAGDPDPGLRGDAGVRPIADVLIQQLARKI